MGVHISVYDCKTGEEPTDWDYLRCVGDRDLAHLLLKTNHIEFNDEDAGYQPSESDWVEILKVPSEDWMLKRWTELRDTVNSDPNLYIELSW